MEPQPPPKFETAQTQAPPEQLPQPSAPVACPLRGAVSPGAEIPVGCPAPNTPSNVNQASNNPVQWSSGLCGCHSDLRSCCITFACPCVTFGEIAEIVDRGSSSCLVDGIIYELLLTLIGCGCFYSCIYRNKMRKQYNIKGTSCGDCCLHTWCELCALCQEYRELQFRGFDMSLGWQGNMERQSHRGMMTPPMHIGMRR